MNILYKPVFIETIEQAEALPEGSIITQEDKDGPWQKWADGYFRGGNKTVVGPEYVLDRFALVPIDAGKEWAAEFESGEMYANLDEESARAADGGTAMARLVTPWEEA